MNKIKSLADLVSRTGTQGILEYEPLHRFLAMHTIDHHEDRNGNGDDVFNGAGMDQADRFPHHGYENGQDTEVYKQANLDVLDNLRQFQIRAIKRWMADNQESELGQRMAPVMNNIVSKGA